MPYFIATNVAGPTWVPARAMRDQDGWAEHAAFVNGLMRDGFVVLGGPVGDGHPHRAILIVVSKDEESARDRLKVDPWIRSGILELERLEPWSILVSQDVLDPLLARFDAGPPAGSGNDSRAA
jgi:hypothetical protein